MNLERRIILAFFCIILYCCSKAQTVYPNYVDGSVYLKLRDTSTLELTPYTYTNLQFNALCIQYGVNAAAIAKPFPDATLSLGLSKVYRMHCNDSTHIDSLISHLQKIPSVEYAEKEPVLHLFYTPNDINGNQWYLSKLNAINAWDFTRGSASVVIAIVDNAIRITHSDLSANIWTNPGEIANNFIDDDLDGYTDDIHGYDIADHDNNPNPPATVTNTSPFVHGTHCAGIAAGVTDNSKGIASIGFNTRIMAVKCTPDKGDGSTLTNAYDGVYYAMKAHANIISMSWGGAGGFSTGQSVIAAASQMGIVLVAAAGNSDSIGVDFPAAYPGVIAVGATDINDVRSSFSNYGSGIDVMAPGTGIYSTLAGDDNSYGYLSGTSMSTPMVAGLAALVKALHPTFTPTQVEAAIKAGCDNIDGSNPTFIGKLGAGRINAYRTFKPNVGINTNTASEALTVMEVFPNPASAILHYTFEAPGSGTVSVSLRNILGQKIVEQKVLLQQDMGSGTIDVRGLTKGIWFLEVENEGVVTSRKIMIE